MKKVIEGSHAIAEAVRLCEPKVIASYPITPQTHIVERISEMVADGELKAEFLNVESEHSAMSACIGAQSSGVRTFTASCSQGLALMHETLFVASGMRLPIVMAVANRALSAPLNIWCDWSDSIAERDSGWIQLYCEHAQEAFDTIIQAYKISENKKVSLPSMVCIDGFFLSHVYEPVEIADKMLVKRFLPKYSGFVMDFNKPVSQGTWAGPDYYQEFKKQQQEAMENAKEVIKDVNSEFENVFGRGYGNGLVEMYNMGSAEHAIITMGSLCGTLRHVLERERIKDIGLIKVKSLRPFPEEDLRRAMKNLKSAGVLEKDISFGLGGALYSEVRGLVSIPIGNFIGGLGGRDVTIENIRQIFEKIRKGDEKLNWV